MKFMDAIKDYVSGSVTYADLSTTRILLTLLMTFGIAVYIFFVYRLATKSAFYFKNYNISMAIISVVTAGIILAMQSSIVISLGMVGALSIVRFRTAIKDPLDLLFLFWSISIGIICGAGFFKLAVILSIVVTVGILLLDMFPVRISSYLLIINANKLEHMTAVLDTIRRMHGSYRIKSKNITQKGIDLIIEIRCKKEQELLEKISKMEGIETVSMLFHDDEVKH